jgi:release factor glutamine methyltransferase
VSEKAAPRPLELARLAAEHLAAKGVADARLDAELLLAHVLGLRRLDLYLQFERPVGADAVAAYREAVRRRARREPLQYITGEAAFREITVRVDPRVLIPRPETEVLVGEVLAAVGGGTGAGGGGVTGRGTGTGRGAGGATGGQITGVDIGTGSGAIALSLLEEGAFARVVATDVSPGALEVAASNAVLLGLEERLELRRGSVWEPIGEGERFHVIVANPPYVMESERAALMPEVRDHEPESALFGGEDGLAVIRELVSGAPSHLHAGGLLALEVGPTQARAVAKLMGGAGLVGARVVPDLTGRDRLVLARRNGAMDLNVE